MTSHDECTKECAKTATPKSGWLEQVVDASDARPFPFPRPYKKEGKGSGPPDYYLSMYLNSVEVFFKISNFVIHNLTIIVYSYPKCLTNNTT